MMIEFEIEIRLFLRIRAPRRKAPFWVVVRSLYVLSNRTGPTQVMFTKRALVNGNLPEPAASLSDSKVSDVEEPDGAFQLKSKKEVSF